jgi:hypothetical protein
MHSIRFTIILLAIVGCVVFFPSCDKTDRDEDIETLTARENALAYHLFDDAFREMHRVAMRDSLLNDTGIGQWFNGCIKRATVSDTVAVFPLNLTINYGDAREICDDGFTRFGIIRATFSGKYLNKGTSVEVTFENYEKDFYKISGTSTLTNLGLNSDGYITYSWIVEDALIKGINTNIEWEGKHTRTWVAGRSKESQGLVDDDVFQISGVASGRNSRGNTFTNEITQIYVSDLSCQWFPTGRSELNIPNLELRTINYDTGDSCNNTFYERRNNTYFVVEIPF